MRTLLIHDAVFDVAQVTYPKVVARYPERARPLRG